MNLEKSDLIPSQLASYLGIELDTLAGLTRLYDKRVTNWISMVDGWILGTTVTARPAEQ